MNFTTTPPTTPGFYAWKLFVREIANPCWVTTDGESYWRDGKYPATNGYWCRLVPAEEVEKAYKEGARHSMLLQAEIDYEWNHSHAKQVTEGKI